MEDLQEALQSILSDPEQMARVAALAESLGLKPPDGEATGNGQQATGETGGSTAGAAAASPACRGGGPASRPVEGFRPPEAPYPGEASPSCHSERSEESVFSSFPSFGAAGMDLAGLLSRLSAMKGSEDRVLSALRSALDPGGQARVDRALRAARLSRLAGSLLKQGRAERV